MNLQQLKYIVAINRFRNFAKAADSCNISQPTLSAMLLKLEEELDVRIFDRTNKQVTPTSAGEKIILQVKKTLLELEKITELVAEEKNQIGKSLSLSVGPSIAPYILPKFIKHYRKDYPEVNLSIQEMKSEEMFHVLQDGEIDAGIAISDLPRKGILEIPLYTERFYVYLSEDCWRKLPVFKPENLEHENMWIMKEAQCLRDSAFSFCKARSKGHHIYESGSIETLIRIVDENGGFTIIPEMHLEFLNEAQRKNVRKIEGDYLSHIEHEEFEGVQVFIEFEREAWGIDSLNLICQSCIYQPLDGQFEICGSGTFLHGSIDELLVLFGKLGRDTVPHHINARHFSIWCVLREISAIVLYNLLLDGTDFLQSLLLYMGEYGGWHSSYIIILSQQADQFCFQ
jgi:LysR family transcriptional regulator, hydrogen peroxide-inducible genes activator